MIALAPPLRPATAADAPALARLVNDAGEGIPLHLWTGMAGEGEDPWEIGRRRQAGKAAEGRIVVVDEGAGAIASLTGYAICADPLPTDDLPPMFRPLQELENLAPGSWYVNVLAVMPDHRGRGLGTLLLDTAARIARAEGLDRLSLIVADNNARARALYRRSGYVETAERPMVKDGWQSEGTAWVLMIRDV